MSLKYDWNGRIKQRNKQKTKKTADMIIKVMGKWPVQSNEISGYSHFNRRQTKDAMDSEERKVGCVTHFEGRFYSEKKKVVY